MKYFINRSIILSKQLIIASIFSFVILPQSFAQSSDNFVYLQEEYLEAVQAEIDKGNDYFVNAYNRALNSANNKLSIQPNPLTRKSIVPPSGDKHDYISIAPYLWPDASKPNGLPWIGRDGEINPDTRGDATDVTRTGEMMRVLLECGMALYFSDDDKYAQKIKEHLNAWFIDSETKMNPNLNYAQSHPGKNDGNWFGIIEWGRVNRIINTIQIMEQKNKLSSSEMASLEAWFTDYLNWLETSEFGIAASNRTNNHAVWYYRQVIGINLFLGNNNKAKSYIDDVKTKLIQVQIEPDGRMPRELERTKSIDYTATNIEGFIDMAKMAENMGVNLWGYETSDGRSIPKTIDFTIPYIKGERTWEWQDIKYNTSQEAFEKEIYPLISKAGRMFDTEILPASFGVSDYIGLYDILTYPPLDKLQLGPKGYTLVVNENQTVNVTGTKDIAYGANGQFNYLYNQTSNVGCNNTAFGGDPISGVAKKCYIRESSPDYTPPGGYTLDVNEGGTVNVSGTMNVAFGANGQFRFLYNQTSNVACNRNTFGGDPAPGKVKKCYVKSKGDIAIGTYFLKNKASGNYLDSDGTTIRVKAKAGGLDQRWKFAIPADLHYNIDNMFSGRGVLDANSNGVVQGSSVESPSTANDKEWTVESLGNNTYRFKNVQQDRFLAEKSSSNAIEHTNWNGDRAQWILEEVSLSKVADTKTETEVVVSNLLVYPNPTEDGVFTIFVKGAETLNVSLYNILGAKIYEVKVSGDKLQTPVNSRVNSGVYLLKVLDQKNKEYVQKIFIK